MSEFLGSRISLISKSDIRYVGTLHEINSDESTVSLENVKSFGTEGRRGGGPEEAAPSDQIYEYIVFRGKDVKDLRVEEGPSTVKENQPPVVPDDPAIVGARARPNNIPPGPPNQQGPPGGPGGPGFGYYPPPMGWGRGGAPPPMQGFGGMQYPPPPAGWFPPGQGFPPGPQGPQGPPGAGQWGNYPQQPFPPGPGGPSGAPGLNNRQPAQQESRPEPIGATSDRNSSTPAQQGNIHQQPKPVGQPIQQQAPTQRGPPPPVDSKPTVEEVKATAASLVANAPSASEPSKSIPTGPKNTSRPTQIMPVVPLPAALTARVAQQTPAAPSNLSPDTQSALRDATQAAKAAVAVAMAKLENPGGSQQASNAAVDNLTRQVIEMRVNAPRGDAPRGSQHTGGGGGRGRGPHPAKVEVPDADFDFASSNAKFNKEEVVKEAIATGSPLGEYTPNGEEAVQEAAVLDTTPGTTAPPAYNKQKSFFDNISSEAKDRADSSGQKPGGREWRGEEQRKNMETFGQGSVDGGYRGGYRGRGRGRGNRGRGFARGGAPRGGGAPFRNGRETQSAS